ARPDTRVDAHMVDGTGREIAPGGLQGESSGEYVLRGDFVCQVDDRGVGRASVKDAFHHPCVDVREPEIGYQGDDSRISHSPASRNLAGLYIPILHLPVAGAGRAGVT